MDQNQESATASDYVALAAVVGAIGYGVYCSVKMHRWSKEYRNSIKENMKNHPEK